MSQASQDAEIFSQVLVIGGGVSGLTMGLAAAQAGFATIVADATELDRQKQFDSRAFAIAPASMRLFAALGMGERLLEKAEPVLRMAIADAPRKLKGGSTLRLDFAPCEAGAQAESPLAYIVENKDLKDTLAGAAKAAPNLQLRYGHSLRALEQHPGYALAAFADHAPIRAQLIVGADGRNSFVRNLCAIDGSGWSYPQTAIAATIAHDKAHDGVAHDIFGACGPLGVLPLTGQRSSIVWCESALAAAELVELPPDAFCAELQMRLGGRLGGLQLEGQRSAFPLSVFMAHTMIAPRLALIADAAHAIHPLAGQGLNIGLRDIAALADTLIDARAIGLDIGAETTLERYQRWRRFDNLSYAAATDGLNRIFAEQAGPLRALRSVGLAMVNSITPLREAFAKEASGLSEAAPRLLRGEALTPA